jgi:hypothetical protein
MKTKIKPVKPEALPPSPLFEFTIRQRGAKAAPQAKAVKRDNIFSKSRDSHEDRGERQMKTTHNPQTFPHGR